MLQITPLVTAPELPPAFVPKGFPIQFPPGTTVSYRGQTWALYINQILNRSWMGYAVPSGTKIVKMGGVRRVAFDFDRLDSYVRQRQRSGCSACDD